MDKIVLTAAAAAGAVIVLGLAGWLIHRALTGGSDPFHAAGRRGFPGGRSSAPRPPGRAYRTGGPGSQPGADFGGPAGSEVSNSRVVVDVNGEVHRYGSLEEVPAELRGRIRDLMASGGSGVRQRIRLNINGRKYEYDSMDEVPEHLRRFLPPHLRG